MQPIEAAREYIRSRVERPALNHPDLDQAIKGKVANSDRWLGRFQRVGDLVDYLKRFEEPTGAPVYTALKALGLTTYEDIVGDFEREFATWAGDRTTLSDFVIGEDYETWDILTLVHRYDARAGGMFVLGPSQTPDAVVIKATLEGGQYANAWLVPHQALKYYMKSRSGAFGEHYVENAAILNHPQIPVYAFVRPTDNHPFTFEGVFHYHRHVTEPDQSKWFELHKAGYGDAPAIVTQERLDEELHEALERAADSTPDQRHERLANAPKKPRRVVVQSSGFVRNADVIAEVLARAAGYCEDCGQPAPFNRSSDGSPYLEVHHRKRLADGGEDTVENAAAFCPNCHRKAHYG